MTVEINTKGNLYPKKDKFVKPGLVKDEDRIFTFAIGSNNNNIDWNIFLENSQNRGKISKTKYLDGENIDSFRNCLKYVDEGILDNFYLTFSSYSYKRGGWGIADLRYDEGCKMRGCIFELISDDKITKKHIINLIRWKEDFPLLYKEINVRVQTKTKSYNCIVYVINKDSAPLNDIFIQTPLPPSAKYIKLVLDAHRHHNFNPNWLITVENIQKKSTACRRKLTNLIDDLYKKYNTSYKLITFMKNNYNNREFRSFRQTKENKDKKEEFKVYVLLSCQYVIYLSQTPILTSIQEKKILKIINNMDFKEKRYISEITRHLITWNYTMKGLQSA